MTDSNIKSIILKKELSGECYLCDKQVRKPGDQYCKNHSGRGNYYPYIFIEDSAAMLGVGPDELLDRIDHGEARGRMIKGRWYIHMDSLTEEDEDEVLE